MTLARGFFRHGFSQAAAARTDLAEDKLRDVTLYADEFQRIATDSFESILSEARKARLNLVLSHQFLGQFPVSCANRSWQCWVDRCLSCWWRRRRGLAGRDEKHGASVRPVKLAYLNVAAPIVLTDTPNTYAWTKLLEYGAPTEVRLAHMLSPECRSPAGSTPCAAKPRTLHAAAGNDRSEDRSLSCTAGEEKDPTEAGRSAQDCHVAGFLGRRSQSGMSIDTRVRARA